MHCTINTSNCFRWQPTRAPNPWEGILQATSHGPVCPQRFPVDMRSDKGLANAVLRMPKQRLRQLQLLRSQLLRQSEDCLYLNIFVPLKNEKSSSARKRGKIFNGNMHMHGTFTGACQVAFGQLQEVRRKRG